MSRLYSFAIAHIILPKLFTRELTLIKILRTKQLQISRSNKFDYIIEKKSSFHSQLKITSDHNPWPDRIDQEAKSRLWKPVTQTRGQVKS